ncbi:MAG: hypothetical protein ACI97A_002862 [Planctomycetota bacterium]|jgi:hypothetical protein
MIGQKNRRIGKPMKLANSPFVLAFDRCRIKAP